MVNINKQKLYSQLSDKNWRLNNLYKIKDAEGNIIQFKPNYAQQSYLNNKHCNNIILKSRQEGFSTMIQIDGLDSVLFQKNYSFGVLAQTQTIAREIMRDKFKVAYKYLPNEIKEQLPIERDNVDEMAFSHGSSIRVGTTIRGSTFNKLHISEFGYICAYFPDRAKEIVGGALNTIKHGQEIDIESTAEGKWGAFYDYVEAAKLLEQRGDELTTLDFKFHFFPWYKSKRNRLTTNKPLIYNHDYLAYFEKCKNEYGVDLDIEQKNFYFKKGLQQGEQMYKEYPTTPEEAFHAVNDGSYYTAILNRLEQAQPPRMTRAIYDKHLPVITAWDLGRRDYTAIWFAQIFGDEVRLIDYYEANEDDLQTHIRYMKAQPYIYHDVHLFPHDIMVTDLTSRHSRKHIVESMGVNVFAIPSTSISNGIRHVRDMLPKCWFDVEKCEKGIKHLRAYRKSWNEKLACFNDKPMHDESSHCADALRVLATGYFENPSIVGRVARQTNFDYNTIQNNSTFDPFNI